MSKWDNRSWVHFEAFQHIQLNISDTPECFPHWHTSFQPSNLIWLNLYVHLASCVCVYVCVFKGGNVFGCIICVLVCVFVCLWSWVRVCVCVFVFVFVSRLCVCVRVNVRVCGVCVCVCVRPLSPAGWTCVCRHYVYYIHIQGHSLFSAQLNYNGKHAIFSLTQRLVFFSQTSFIKGEGDPRPWHYLLPPSGAEWFFQIRFSC